MRHYNTTIDSALSKLRHLAALGGGGGDIPPLSRESFIDNGSQGGTGDGSIASPFKTITGWITAKATPRVSNADAAASQTGILCQSIGGYVNEAVSFPPYASTELRGFASPSGSPVGLEIESLIWHNVAGAHAPVAAVGVLKDASVGVLGITYTDDAGAPPSELVLVSSYGTQMEINGPITATGTIHALELVFIQGPACLGDIDVLTDLLTLPGTAVRTTSVTASAWIADGTEIDLTTINLTNDGRFSNCDFEGAPVLTCASTTTPVVFDGPSLHSFQSAGGTVAAGTLVTVAGGYDACAYEGPNGQLPAAGDAVISIDGQAAGTTQADGGNSYFVAPTAAHAVQIKNSGESDLDTICIAKTNSAGDAAYSIKNNAGAVVAVMPAGAMGFVVMQKKAGDWVPVRSGSGVTTA